MTFQDFCLRGISLPCPSSVYGQDPNSSAFNWVIIADQSECFSHRSLQRKISGLTQTQQAWQHAFLEKVDLFNIYKKRYNEFGAQV